MTEGIKRSAKPVGILGGGGAALLLFYRLTVAVEGMEKSLDVRLSSVEAKVTKIEHGVEELHNVPIHIAQIKTILAERK